MKRETVRDPEPPAGESLDAAEREDLDEEGLCGELSKIHLEWKEHEKAHPDCGKALDPCPERELFSEMSEAHLTNCNLCYEIFYEKWDLGPDGGGDPAALSSLVYPAWDPGNDPE